MPRADLLRRLGRARVDAGRGKPRPYGESECGVSGLGAGVMHKTHTSNKK